MHKKINIWLSLFIIALIAIIFAFAISARGAMPFIFGGRITKVTPCVLDTPSDDPIICLKSCPRCSILGSKCALYQEITFKPANGSKSSFICPLKGYPIIGGLPKAGAQLLGGGTWFNTLRWVGVSPR